MFVNTTRPALLVRPVRSITPLTTTFADGSGLPRRSVTQTLTVAVAPTVVVVSTVSVALTAGAAADISSIRQSTDFMEHLVCGRLLRSGCHGHSTRQGVRRE